MRSRPCLAEPPALSPSTMKISQNLRIPLLAIRQFAGQQRRVQRSLAPRQVAGLARRFARPRRFDRLGQNPARHRRILLQESAQAFVDGGFDHSLDFAVPQLGFGLSFELGIPQLDADNRHQSFAHILAGRILLQILQQIVGLRVGIDRARQRRFESGQVRPALVRVDVVGKGEDRLAVAVVVLHRHFNDDILLPRSRNKWAWDEGRSCSCSGTR